MFGPIVLFPRHMFASNDDGSEKMYLSDNIPFAAAVSVLLASLHITTIDTATNVNLYLRHSLDGVNFEPLETMTSAGPVTSIGYTTYDNAKNFGPFCRIALGIADNAAAGRKMAEIEARVIGKPIGV